MKDFDFVNPQYEPIVAERLERLKRLREHPEKLPALKAYYAEHIAAFIGDFGVTSDPRLIAMGRPAQIPLVLMPKQIELVDWIIERWRRGESGVLVKSRDVGASVISMDIACSLALLFTDMAIGFGSATELKLDRSSDPDTLFAKGRMFLSNLPSEFSGGFDVEKHSAHMRLFIPETGSSITGESGTSIGRGSRKAIFFVDEASHLERSELIDRALASTTGCRIDMSSVNGMANSFAEKARGGKIPRFDFTWHHDKRKNYPGSTWYRDQCEKLDGVTVAQEIDCNFAASTEGLLIPAPWIDAMIGAHIKLGITPTGERRAALDVSDEGKDRNCFAGRHGILLEHLQSWSGKGSDIFRTVVRTFGLCEEFGYGVFDFDSDGLGASCRGDAVAINAQRREAGKAEINAEPFRGSAAVAYPEDSLVEGRLNKDYFANLKSQCWWALRLRAQATYRAVIDGLPYNPDDIISIAPDLPELATLVVELSQPTYSLNNVGRILVDKVPDGTMSPNAADAVMICFNPFHPGAYFSPPVPSAPEGFKVCPLPTRMEQVFALMTFLDDAAAVIYCAVSRHGSPPFHVIDYDVVEFATPKWVGGIASRVEELFEVVSGCDPVTGAAYGIKQTYVDDPRDISTEFLRQCGFSFASFDKDFRPDQVLPPVAERFAKARPYVTFGLAVASSPALEREVPFRGVKRAFLRELMSQATVVQSNPLAQVFASAVLGFFKNAPAVALAAGDEIPASPPRKRRALPPPPHPHILLKPGRHVIDGEVVEMPGELGQMVRVFLSVGRHIVDDKIAYASKPGAGIPWEP
jgi:phage terminase large subunit